VRPSPFTVMLTAAVAVAALASTANSQDAHRLRFTAATDLVQVDVAVTSSEGRYVPGLGLDDFTVLEDGIAQEITHFSAEPSPASLVLLLDVSSSIRPSLGGVKSGAYRFIRGLSPDDSMLIGFFNDDLWFTKEFSNDRVALAREVQAMRPRGLTALYDAILASLQEFPAAHGRKALILFADGDDSRPAEEGSVASAADAIEAGKLSEATIYSVGFEGRRAAGRGVNRGFLRQLSANSGGLAFFPKNFEQLDSSFAQIQTELKSQYRLSYVPNNTARDGTWREIEIRVDGGETLIVRSRQGYYASEPDS